MVKGPLETPNNASCLRLGPDFKKQVRPSETSWEDRGDELGSSLEHSLSFLSSPQGLGMGKCCYFAPGKHTTQALGELEP